MSWWSISSSTSKQLLGFRNRDSRFALHWQQFKLANQLRDLKERRSFPGRQFMERLLAQCNANDLAGHYLCLFRLNFRQVKERLHDLQEVASTKNVMLFSTCAERRDVIIFVSINDHHQDCCQTFGQGACFAEFAI